MIINEIKHSFVLTENDKRRIIKAVNEALAINDSLTDKTEEIYNEFMSELRRAKFQYLYSPDFKVGMVEFQADFFGIEITFEFRCYNVLDKDRYEAISDRFQLGNAFFNKKNNSVLIYVGLISGTIQTPVKSLLQHELEHVFQLMHGKTLNSKVGEESYNKAFRVLTNGTNSETEMKVAYIIYTQSETETDAFANQLYQDLKTSNGLNPDKVVKESQIFSYYKNSNRLLKEIKTNREKFEEEIKRFGYSYDKFINLFGKLNKRTMNKIGKVLARYNQENQPTDVVMNKIRLPEDI